MRVVLLGAALLGGVGLLGSTPTAQGQDSGRPYAAPYRGPDRGDPMAAQGCGGYGRPACSNYSYGSLAADNPGCPSSYPAYGGSPYGNWTYTRYNSSQNSPFFAAGGEAYSYAGYGDFRSVGYGVGTNSPSGAYGTAGFGACSRPELGPAGSSSNGGTSADGSTRTPAGP